MTGDAVDGAASTVLGIGLSSCLACVGNLCFGMGLAATAIAELAPPSEVEARCGEVGPGDEVGEARLGDWLALEWKLPVPAAAGPNPIPAADACKLDPEPEWEEENGPAPKADVAPPPPPY